MFSLFSKLRFISSGAPEDDEDVPSSLLTLPLPVTESLSRQPVSRNWTTLQQSTANGMHISRPTPQTATGLSSTPSGSANVYTRQLPSEPPKSFSVPGAWDEEEKLRRHSPARMQRSPASARPQIAYPLPAVVRLDSEPLPDQDENDNPSTPGYTSIYNPLASFYSQQTGFKTSSKALHRAELEEYDNGQELYNSPFDSDLEDAVPVAPVTLASSPSPASIPGGSAMTKARWNLRLQLHPTSHFLPPGASPPQPGFIFQNDFDNESHLHQIEQNHFDSYSTPFAHTEGGQQIEKDVYRNAYSYPLAKQLSPIVEQDYISPGAESDSRSGSLSIKKSSPAVENLVTVVGSARNDRETANDAIERSSVRTKTVSFGSVATNIGNISRSGSMGVSAVGGGSQNGSPGGSLKSEVTHPSPVCASPFIKRPVNRSISQTSSKSDPQTPSQIPGHVGALQIQKSTSLPVSHITQLAGHSPNNSLSGKEVAQTPTSTRSTGTATTGAMYTPTPTLQNGILVAQTPTSPVSAGGVSYPPIRPPPVAVTQASDSSIPHHPPGFPKIPSLPAIPPLNLRFSILGSVAPRASREFHERISWTPSTGSKKVVTEINKMPVIDGSAEGYNEEEEIDEDDQPDDADSEDENDQEYERESLHAESFVTARQEDDESKSPFEDKELGQEQHQPSSGSIAYSRHPSPTSILGAIPSSNKSRSGSGENIISASPIPTPFLTKWQRRRSNASWLHRIFSPFYPSFPPKFTPAFITFWLGFLFPVLWLVGGWHFTSAGELPPRFSAWEWYLWGSSWSVGGWFRSVGDHIFCCFLRRPIQVQFDAEQQRNIRVDYAQNTSGFKRSKRTNVQGVPGHPPLPRWVAEKQTSDGGLMRLNDPKRLMRGISYEYPFIPRPRTSQDSAGIPNSLHPPSLANASSSSLFFRAILSILAKPNRALDLLYGIKLKEVRGRPESPRWMFDLWIQRCRYAFCYTVLFASLGMCIASVYLIVVNTKTLT